MGVAKAVVMLVTDKSADDVKGAVNEALAAGSQATVKKIMIYHASVQNSFDIPSFIFLCQTSS